MSTRQVLGAVGAAIGGYFFGPQGAQWGWAIGSAVGGAIDPEIIKGPSVGDIAAQTSQEGVPRPIVFALSPPMAGNIIASGEPRIVRKRERQGKGGPKVETESVYRTYAVGVCEGPITRFVRVWRNGTLVYDVTNEVMGTDLELDLFGEHFNFGNQNGQFLENARFFLGDWDQEPSPDLETLFGVGTTPAHRGTAYMVMADEDLTDLRGAIPQYQFQVERCEGFYLTSRPYALEDLGGVDVDLPDPRRGYGIETIEEGVSMALVTPQFGELYGSLEAYSLGDPEGVDVALVEPLFGEIYGTLEEYEGEAEAVDAELPTPLSGDLYGDLIDYDNWPAEGVDATVAPLDGELT